jgi:N-acetyl-alpha-D-muramate 1-phosphate uridylyltransferase
MSAPPFKTAMVLAAGLGQRMRPITASLPKPLIKVAGRALIDHALDRLADAGVETAVVNVHHLADLVEAHLRSRQWPKVVISDERAALLDTGGGVKRALPLIGEEAFVLLNSDSLWIDGPEANLARLMQAWNPQDTDILLLLADRESLGYQGAGDFVMAPDGLLRRRPADAPAPHVYAGAAILKPTLFADTPNGAFSLNHLFDRAIDAGRLRGLALDGEWLHVGTPDSIGRAEARLAASVR